MSFFVSIDSEFTRISEPKMRVVCFSLRYNIGYKETIRSFVFEKNSFGKWGTLGDFKNTLEDLREMGAIFIAHAAEAEGRALLSLGIDPLKFQWVDTLVEYSMLLNRNDAYEYGKQLINGEKKFTYKPPPKWERKNEDEEDAVKRESNKAQVSLAAACYKILGKLIDTERKNRVRDLIISEKFTEEDLPEIVEYCESDIARLESLFIGIFQAMKKSHLPFPKKKYLKQAIKRGEYSMLVAKMVHEGYPVNIEQTRNFAASVDNILRELKRDINQKTEHQIGFQMFDFSEKKQKKKVQNGNVWVRLEPKRLDGNFKQKAFQELIEKEIEGKKDPRFKNWPISKKSKKPSLKEEIISSACGDPRHDFSSDYLEQLLRFLRVKKSLNGFLPAKKGKKNFFDYVGSDGKVRPYFHHYGSQSSRSQPAATGFIPLKAAWMRYLIQPPEGYVCIGIDYGSEEYLIAALASEDEEMISSYREGDVYLSFGKKAGVVPPTATKKTHGLIREKLKATTLMVQFGAGPFALAAKLSAAAKEEVSESEAETLIELFEDTYSDYTKYKWDILREYEEEKVLFLPDGWTMFGDNDNAKSVQNTPIQGRGGVIMREAHRIAVLKKTLRVIYTLHDALYIICRKEVWRSSALALGEAMIEGFRRVMGSVADVRLEADVWGDGLEEGKEELSFFTRSEPVRKISLPCKLQKRYIDPRAVSEVEKFKGYMEGNPENFF